MADWQITIRGKGVRRDTVDKLANSLKDKYGEDAVITIKDATPPTSRADRLSAAQNLISDARTEFEELRDELQEWYDNLPENFQNGEKGGALQAAIDELENYASTLEEAENAEVEFPTMFG